MTTPSQFQKIRACLHELLDMDKEAQARRLQQLRTEDPLLAESVADLLGRIEPADLQPELPASTHAVGQRIGAFELIELIGHGGMGLVYRAERVDGSVSQRVAIKLPNRSLLLPQEERRLKRERNLLARLEHPHIARFIDAGNAPGIGPWFAMEYVDGLAITRHADAQRLGIRARLLQWLQLADAVVYAHQHLIVHRDLKPANVLVDGSGRVKLLDFGIAHLFVPDADDRQSLPAFTPRYASPEQISGEPVTTATDVHGLGLLLYELLCARPAFPEQADLELRQAIATSEPPSLRDALTRLDVDVAERASAARALTRQQWRRALGAELDAIVARSLRKRPQDRYASAQEFADDVRRHLSGAKVIAMAPTWRYRLAKFARQHRFALTAVAAVLLALAIGLLLTLSQRDRARAAEAAAVRAEAQALAENGMLADILGGGPDELAGGSDVRVRDLLVSATALVRANAALAPVSRARLLHTLAEGLLALLDNENAAIALDAAEQALSESGGADPGLLLRIKLKRQWIAFERGARATAIEQIALQWPEIERHGGAVLLEALQNRAHFFAGTRDFERAQRDLLQARQLAQSMQPLPQRDLSQIRYNRIHVLMNLQRNQEAYALALEHMAAAQARPAEFVSARISASEMLARAASKIGRSREAESLLEAILPQVETLYRGQGNRLAGIVGALASAHRASGHFRLAATRHVRQAELRQHSLPDSIYVASALRFAGISLRMLGDHEGARRHLLRARALFAQLASDGEVLHCDLHLAAIDAAQQRDGASLRRLMSVVERIVRDGEPADRIEAPTLAIEAALAAGNAEIAERQLAELRAVLEDQNASIGEHLYADLLAVEWSRMRGVSPKLDALHAASASTGNDYLFARVSLLNLSQAAPAERAAACRFAESAWAKVDGEGHAWRQLVASTSCHSDPLR